MTRILAFGASVVAGFWDSEGGWVHRLKTDLHSISKIEDVHYQVYNLGVSGHTSKNILSRIEDEIDARKDEEEHDLIIFVSTSGNDCLYDSVKDNYRIPMEKFMSNFRQIIKIAKENAEETYFVGNQPVDPDQVDENTMLDRHQLDVKARKDYFQAANQICRELNVEVINISKRIREQEFKSRLYDGLHPDTKGHQMIYEEVKAHLDRKSSLKVSM